MDRSKRECNIKRLTGTSLAVTAVVVLSEDAAAQYRTAARFPRAAAPTSPAIDAPTAGLRADALLESVSDSTSSTLPERFVGGLVFGLAGAGLMHLAADSEFLTVAAYAVGSAGGVMAATVPREGVRPVRVIAGTLIGVVPLVVLESMNGGSPVSAMVGLLLIPLAGAYAHGAP